MIIFILVFLITQTLLSIHKPEYFLWIYILYTTSFLGFVPNTFFISKLEVGMYYQSLLMLFIYIIRYKKVKLLNPYLSNLLNLMVILYIYGILKPVVSGNSSIIQSLVASKEFSTIFLIHYLLANLKSVSYKFIYETLKFYSYYIMLILLLFITFKIYPPAYYKSLGRIEFYHPTILSLFLFIESSLANTYIKKMKVLGLLIIWIFGMIANDHTAILLSTLFGCLIVLMEFKILFLVKNLKNLILILSGLVIAYFVLPGGYIINRILETDSFKSREIYNAGRLEMINIKLYEGYGFLHKSAFTLDENNIYMESLSFIDSGYIDLLGKFGLIGMILYLITLIVTLMKYNINDLYVLALKLFILQYIFICFTWSVFSYSMGLICISLTFFLLEFHHFYVKHKLRL